MAPREPEIDQQLAPPEPITTKDVVFTEATPRQRELSWRLNGASWAPPMTIDQYIGRETTLSQTALSAGGGTTYFVLHPRGDPDTIVSACEVTRKRALVVGSDPADNQPREVAAYSVASVFTNPRFRERGMASHLLRMVREHADGAMAAELGALYSDIGRVFYTRLGWRDSRTPQVVATLADGVELGATLPDAVVLLDEGAVLARCEKDVALLRASLAGLAGDGKTHAAFLPTPEQMAWHFTRDGYVCRTLLGREVVHRGAATADGAAWVCWDHDLRDKKLKVLRIVTDGKDSADKQRADAKGLLLAALAEAKGWGLPKMLVWSPSAAVAAAATELWQELGPNVQVLFEEREDGSIPSLRWKEGRSLDEVVWECNEYYAWC